MSPSYVLKTRARIEREMRNSACEHPTEAAFQAAVDIATEEEIQEAQADAAFERDLYGIPEDSPCLQSADLWGTGEGQYHGII